MKFLVDTNVLSEMRKGGRGNIGVQRWSKSVQEDSIHISVLALGEIRKGIAMKAPRDPQQGATLENWLSGLKREHATRTLTITSEVAELWGTYRVPGQLSQVDGLMAATAEINGLVFVTRNTRHVAFTGAKLFNPFDA